MTDQNDIHDNLRQCCSSQLNKRLFDVKGTSSLNAVSEGDLLLWIKENSVKGIHTEVHRTQFVNMKQKQGESVNSFFARLKAEASQCNFHLNTPAACSTINCACPNQWVSSYISR